MNFTKLFVGTLALSAMLAACVDGSVYGTLTDTRAVKTYKTVKIGAQTWMAENLNYETGNSYCYDNNASNCTKYGRLYTWAAAQNACPDGWHLPSKAEFETLLEAVGGVQDSEDYWLWQEAGKKLKSTRGWNEYEGESGNGTDSFGFSALPAGYWLSGGGYLDEGGNEAFWGSSEDDSGNAILMGLFYSNGGAYLDYDGKDGGFSVRCLKD